jgi:hypothetical protein
MAFARSLVTVPTELPQQTIGVKQHLLLLRKDVMVSRKGVLRCSVTALRGDVTAGGVQMAAVFP